MHAAVPFRLPRERRATQLQRFNARAEIAWFGFQGRFEEPGTACIALLELHPGALGGGGTAAINGGVIAAGFDAAFVLAGLGHYDTDVVVTLELSVQFLRLARAIEVPAIQARVLRSSRHVCFVEGELVDRGDASLPPFAVAKGMLSPVA